MLPPFIIDQIRKREQERQHEEARPQLEIPLPPLMPAVGEPRPMGYDDGLPARERPSEPGERGVVIIDLFNP